MGERKNGGPEHGSFLEIKRQPWNSTINEMGKGGAGRFEEGKRAVVKTVVTVEGMRPASFSEKEWPPKEGVRQECIMV